MELLKAIWLEFSGASFLEQLGAVAALLGVLGVLNGLTAKLAKRVPLRDLARARARIDALDAELSALKQKLDVEKADGAAFRNRAESLEERHSKESPIAWRESQQFDSGIDDVDGRSRQLKTMALGFDAIREDLRSAAFELAIYYDAEAAFDPDSGPRAQYFANLATALRSGDDTQYLHDLLKESAAADAREQGAYDPEAPEWKSFELAPAGLDKEGASRLATRLSNRAKFFSQTGENHAAHRLLARAVFIAKQHFGEGENFLIHLVKNYSAELFISGFYKSALLHFEELERIMEASSDSEFSPTSYARLQLRHWICGCLLHTGREDEARREALTLLPEIEASLGSEEPLAIGTRSIALGKRSRVGAKTSHVTKYGSFAVQDQGNINAPARIENKGMRLEPIGPSRNDPCPCGSGKKFKHCHGRLA